MALRAVIPYQPRPAFLPMHQRDKRFSVVVAHRRAGKTVGACADLLIRALQCKLPNGRFAYIAPTYAQAKDVAWQYFKDMTRSIPGVEIRESDLIVNLPNKARIRLYGVDNADRLRGGYLDGAVPDEYGDWSPEVWPQVIRPMLSDRNGWASFIGTPKGDNHFADLYHAARSDPEWFTLMLKASETGILPQSELDAARKVMSEEEYQQEFECSFQAPNEGSLFGRSIELIRDMRPSRITRLEYDPGLLVECSFDLGFDDATAIWFWQRVSGQPNFLRYLETSGDHPVDVIAKLRGLGYRFGDFHMPHDADHQRMGMPASIADQFRQNGFSVVVHERAQDNASKMAQINAARNLIERSWFDETECAHGLKALRGYRRQWNAKRKAFDERPLHDWASHGADAFIVAAQAIGAANLTQKGWGGSFDQPATRRIA